MDDSSDNSQKNKDDKHSNQNDFNSIFAFHVISAGKGI
jgi:hypothetical protein